LQTETRSTATAASFATFPAAAGRLSDSPLFGELEAPAGRFKALAPALGLGAGLTGLTFAEPFPALPLVLFRFGFFSSDKALGGVFLAGSSSDKASTLATKDMPKLKR